MIDNAGFCVCILLLTYVCMCMYPPPHTLPIDNAEFKRGPMRASPKLLYDDGASCKYTVYKPNSSLSLSLSLSLCHFLVVNKLISLSLSLSLCLSLSLSVSVSLSPRPVRCIVSRCIVSQIVYDRYYSRGISLVNLITSCPSYPL